MAGLKRGQSCMFLAPSPLPFIPPFDAAIALLGVPSNLGGLVGYLSRKHQADLPVSEKTLRKANYAPVTRSTATKIGNFVLSKLPYSVEQEEVDLLYQPWREVAALNNGYSWHAGVLYPITKLGISIDNSFARFFGFIESRSNQELAILQRFKKLEGRAVARHKLEEIWCEFLCDTTEIQKAEIEAAVPALVKWCTSSELDNSADVSVKRLFLLLTVDFYYSLIACLDFDLSNPLREQDGADDRLFASGLFGNLVPSSSEQVFRQPIEVLLEEWRLVFASSPGTKLTWAEMYRKLPYPHEIPPEERIEL